MNIRRFIEKVDKKKKEILKQSKLSNAELHIFMAGMNSAMEAIEECGGDCCSWIPVAEQLPKAKEDVLICMKSGWILIGWYGSNGKRWHITPADAGITPEDIVAWSPLPEPFNPQN